MSRKNNKNNANNGKIIRTEHFLALLLIIVPLAVGVLFISSGFETQNNTNILIGALILTSSIIFNVLMFLPKKQEQKQESA